MDMHGTARASVPAWTTRLSEMPGRSGAVGRGGEVRERRNEVHAADNFRQGVIRTAYSTGVGLSMYANDLAL